MKTILQTLTIVVFVATIGCAHQTPPPSASKPNGSSPATFPLAAAERDRERELRARFAQFWRTATGDRRAVYDTFISATPFAEGVSSEQVETASVRGWWVRPSAAEHDGVILYLHGGGYVAGSA